MGCVEVRQAGEYRERVERRPDSVQTCYAGRVGVRSLAAGVRVRVEVDLAAPAVGDVRVALGRPEVGVPEHLLDRAEVGAALEQVRRERVAEEVRVNALRLEAGLARRACAG